MLPTEYHDLYREYQAPENQYGNLTRQFNQNPINNTRPSFYEIRIEDNAVRLRRNMIANNLVRCIFNEAKKLSDGCLNKQSLTSQLFNEIAQIARELHSLTRLEELDFDTRLKLDTISRIFEVFAYHASNREVGDFDVLFEYEADMRQIQFDKAHLVPFKWMKDVVVEEVAPEQRVLLKLQESARRAVAKLTG